MIRFALTLAFAFSALGLVSTATAQKPKTVGPDVPPELPMSVYKKRRDALAKRLGGCAAAIKSRTTDDNLDEYFYYLTGLEEAGAVLTLAPKATVVKSSLSFPSRNPRAEIWTGYKETVDGKARRKYMVDEAREVSRPGVGRALRTGLRKSKCYAQLRFPGKKSDIPKEQLGLLLKGYEARSIQRWSVLEKMRAIHDGEEVKRLRKAIAITFKGHEAAVRALVPGAVERQVAAAIRDAYFAWGGTGLAFPSIVGTGPNGAILHWWRNDRTVKTGDMAVIDIGAEYGHYAADITRTYPINGSFSKEQREIYEKVLKVQNEIIAMVKPGISLNELNRAAQEKVEAAGHELPHGLGHFVGLEVHDVGDYDAPLEAGMVITVEPGIYLKGNFGVRIEDMVLVTARGHDHISSELPRTPDEVTAWMKQVRSAK